MDFRIKVSNTPSVTGQFIGPAQERKEKSLFEGKTYREVPPLASPKKTTKRPNPPKVESTCREKHNNLFESTA
jgi:hypothetical protein